MSLVLRAYQETIVEQTRAALRRCNAVLISSPTGSGKGSLLSYMVHGATKRNLSVIFGVRGKSLVDDMSKRVRDLGIPHGVLLGGAKRQRWHPVQVASVDTWHRMAHPPKADLIIIDECDGAMSETWRKVIGIYPAAKIVGSTATAYRHDRKPLGKSAGGIFEELVMGPSEQELIDLGFLVPSRVLAPPAPAALGTLKKTAGEFNAAQGAAICDNAKVIGDIVEHWKKYTAGRKTVSFGFNQKHAQDIAESFRCAGIEFAYMDANTSMDERDKIKRDLMNGSLMGLSSVDTVSVGWDCPVISCLIMARKTASLRLHRQMLGRASRPFGGKSDFFVNDHVGNVWYHAPYGFFENPPPCSLDSEFRMPSEKEKATSVATCRFCFATFARGPESCPFCGKQLLKNQRKVEVVAGELKEIVNIIRQPSPAEEPAVEKFLEFLRRRKEKGRPESKAAYAWRMNTGQFPTKVIMEAAKRRLEQEKETNG